MFRTQSKLASYVREILINKTCVCITCVAKSVFVSFKDLPALIVLPEFEGITIFKSSYYDAIGKYLS